MDFFENLASPESLNKLTLVYCKFDWDVFTTKVGSLPNLEKLKLIECYVGAEWIAVEGKFRRLKFSQICICEKLVWWTAESTEFPALERLVLRSMRRLKEIPFDIGETLQSIDLFYCKSSVNALGKRIVEEQQNYGNEGPRLTIQGNGDTPWDSEENLDESV